MPAVGKAIEETIMRSAYRYAVRPVTGIGPAPDPTPGPDPWAGIAEIHVGTAATPAKSRFIYVTAEDSLLMVRLSYDGINYGDDITINPDDPPELYYFSAQRAQVRNETLGNIARYQLTFMW